MGNRSLAGWEKVTAIRNVLSAQLNETGQRLLDELADIEIERCVLAEEDTFKEGFCTGIKLMWAVKDHEK